MVYSPIFLKQLDYRQNKTLYVRITSLNINDHPREFIEGRVTGGNINLDGSSKMQRTCSISMAALEDDVIITDLFWSLNNKFKLEIGLVNDFDENYENIIWFKQGIYIITSFSVQKSSNNLSINISGKDKICRLDGTIGGSFPHEINLGESSEVNDDGTITLKKIPLKEIILYALIQYGEERRENIIIRDLDINGFELWEYRGKDPLYLFKEISESQQEVGYYNLTFNGEMQVYAGASTIKLKDIPVYYKLNASLIGNNETATKIKFSSSSDKEYYVVKVEYGQTAGYHEIALVYNTDLIMKAGENVVGLLNKITTMLGDYEYFYDVDGKFIFQKKNTYTKEIFKPLVNGIIEPSIYSTPYEYEFEDEQLFTSVSNTPNISDIKNDFVIWGKRKGTKNETPFHCRFAIHKKPTSYKDYNGKLWIGDWREIIYQMARDSIMNNGKNDFYSTIEMNNTWCINGVTGYETFYSDMLGFWRLLYYPLTEENDFDVSLTYNPNDLYVSIENYYTDGEFRGWNKNVYESPESLLFWIDFLDVCGELENYSINKIGRRPKNVDDNSISAVDFSTTPEISYILPKDSELEYQTETAYTPLQITAAAETLFSRSAQGIGAIDKINELLNSSTMLGMGKTITSIPIFYLQPNTRIKIKDEDYILSKIVYSLNYNGTMNITASKVIDFIYQ